MDMTCGRAVIWNDICILSWKDIWCGEQQQVQFTIRGSVSTKDYFTIRFFFVTNLLTERKFTWQPGAVDTFKARFFAINVSIPLGINRPGLEPHTHRIQINDFGVGGQLRVYYSQLSIYLLKAFKDKAKINLSFVSEGSMGY